MPTMAKSSLAISAVSLTLTSVWMYAPLVTDWVTRTRAEAAARADLAAALPLLYTPTESVELSRQESNFPYNLAGGCVGDQEAITYGTNLSLPEVILQYNQGMVQAGWGLESLAKPDATYQSYAQAPHSRLSVRATELMYPPVTVSAADRQRYRTIYSIFLEYFSPGVYACRG